MMCWCCRPAAFNRFPVRNRGSSSTSQSAAAAAFMVALTPLARKGRTNDLLPLLTLRVLMEGLICFVIGNNDESICCSFALGPLLQRCDVTVLIVMRNL